MINPFRKISLQQFLYILAFLIALIVRFYNLGDTPLSDFEADRALQSWIAVEGKPVDIGTNPGYFSLTSLIFYFFGSSNSLARFWSALAGSLLVLAPVGLRKFLGREAALIAAFGLALDPGLVTLSRLAGGPMMAVGFGALGISLFLVGSTIWAGILAGIALSSGPSIFSGLLIYFIALGFSRIYSFLNKDDNFSIQEKIKFPSRELRIASIVVGVTLFIVGSLGFSFPSGLGGFGESLSGFFQGWLIAPNIPVFQPILAIVFYQPLALLFASIGILRGWVKGETRVRFLSIFMASALFLSVIYSGRQVYDAVWILLPVWGLAAIELRRYLEIPKPFVVTLGQASIVVVLGILFWLISLGGHTGEYTWLVLIILPFIAVLTTILVGLGWSWDSARNGLIIGVVLILGVYGLSTSFRALHLNPHNPAELWTPSPGTGQVELLEDTLRDLAIIQSGHQDAIEITTLVDSPALNWVLRGFSEVSVMSTLSPGVTSAVIITLEDGSDLSQSMSYRGQDFLWSSYPGWSGALPPWPQWWTWVTTRQVPIHTENIVVWARTDLFPEEPTEAGSQGELQTTDEDVSFSDGDSAK